MARIVNDETGIGLRTTNPRDRVALRGVRLRAHVTALCERTTIEQTFVNQESRAIEAVYTFPLPEDSAVCGFEVITGDHVLTGEVDESRRATEKYENAINNGDGAFLMEQERADIFTIRVGNLKPKQAATIRISYVRALKQTDREIRIAFPTTLAPRYVTNSGGRDPLEALIDGDAVNPPHVLHVPYGLSMEVEVDLGKRLKRIVSPSHPIRVDRDEERDTQRVAFTGGISEMNRDVVLSLEMAKEEEPAVSVGTWKDGKPFLAVTFKPEFDVDELAAPQPADVVFVLDCSGSMQGESIMQATKALELCLRSLSPGDTFNICRFGSSFDLFAREPMRYDQSSLGSALRYIGFGTDLGGTELLAPLEAIFKIPPRAGSVRQIILLTDGQISNEAEVVALARAHRDGNRIFTFGIGSAANSSLVTSLARVTGGMSESIAYGERIEDKVLRTFARIASPQISDVEIDFGNSEVQTLSSIPPIFDGDALAIYGRVIGRLPENVALRGTTRLGPKEWSLNVPSPHDDGGAIALMFARRAIQSYEDVNAIRRPVMHIHQPTNDEQKLIDLSKEFGLLCSLTTFVAIEHRSLEERNDGKPSLRRVPVMLAQGWGNVEMKSPELGMLCDTMAAMPAPAQAIVGRTIDKTMDRTIDRLRDVKSRSGNVPGRVNRFVKKMFAPNPPKVPVHSNVSDLHALLLTQSAEGSFAWNDDVTKLLPRNASELRTWREPIDRELFSLATAHPVPPAATDTALLVLAIEICFSEQAQVWSRGVQKAVRFVANTIGVNVYELKTRLEHLAHKFAAVSA
jgi:Ca-activated chloride channel family protein